MYGELSTLGKKHFIVGYTYEQSKPAIVLEQPVEQNNRIKSDIPFNLVCDDQVKAIYFAPNDDVRSVLKYLIENEKEKIQVAMFAFTDRDLAQAFIQARKRGVVIELIADANNTYGRYNKTHMLHTNNVQVYIYNPKYTQQPTSGVMHNKFLLFKNNILGKSLVWTGSFNMTRSANDQNQENVLVSDDTFIVQKFTNQFAHLKKCCTYYRVPVPVVTMGNLVENREKENSGKNN
jgi:phosphatidylserine/phosphatidylglycerophosphate/cardiolipin synthase-like enzyme